MIRTVSMVLSKLDLIEIKEMRKFSLVKATFRKYCLVCFTIVDFGTAKLRKPNQNRNFLVIFNFLPHDMDLRKRILSFAELGTLLPGMLKNNIWEQAFQDNNWFTKSEIARALNTWSSLLTQDNLNLWTDSYTIPVDPANRNILVITAGNIPLVGFHDFLTVLISGNRFFGRLSSRDNRLIAILAEELIRIEPLFTDQIHFQNFPTSPDAAIATGSDNSSRYFRLTYAQIPHIIRKNRSSIAILDGTETTGELINLAGDVLEYYGLGCRSVSHLFLPVGYPPENLMKPLSFYNQIDPCDPHIDNLLYQRARLSVLNIPYLDTGQILLVGSDNLHSPIGVVHYSFYEDRDQLLKSLKDKNTEIQCIAGHPSIDSKLVPFGSAQKPELWDYADEVDTMEFLTGLR